jgi:hypothetical protein
VIRRLIWADGVVLLAAAGVELALALGAGHVGAQPGDAAPGADAADAGFSAAVIAGIALAVLGSSRRVRATAALVPLAGLFVTASFYTEDPYYAPLRHRYSDGGAVAAAWIYIVLAAAVIAGGVAWRRPRAGGLLAAVMLLVCLVTAALAGDGH